jgi:hypothetical protein
VASDLEILLTMALGGLAMLVVVGGISALVVGSYVRALGAANARWQAFAKERGLAFQSKPPRVWGRVEGVEVAIGLSSRGPAGRGSVLMTSVRAGAPPSSPEQGWLRVVPRGTMAGVMTGVMTGLAGAVPTHDLAFDGRFVVETADPPRALAVLSDEVRARLLAFPRPLELTAGQASVTLVWPGQEADAAVLDEACRLAARALR